MTVEQDYAGMEADRDYCTVVILGAARSGTNMLRDTLAKIPGVGTWPCDEISYIWRHGNLRFPTDELPPECATPEVTRFIRAQFDRFARRNRLQCLLEKTCANTMRVDFVHRVVPEAKFIHLIRDGRDAALSGAEKWRSKLSLGLVLPKVRYAPVSDIPYYAYRFIRTSANRLFSHQKRLAFWGPRFEGMESALREKSVTEVAAMQWQRSVQLTMSSLKNIAAENVYTLHYEDFVANPAFMLGQLAKFIEMPISSQDALAMTTNISTRSVGRAASALEPQLLHSVEKLIADTLKASGYKLRHRQRVPMRQAG